MNLTEQRVREFAYQIWESEGRPFGHSERHWEMASKLAASHEGHAHADTDIPSSEPVEPISPGQPQTQPVSDPIQPDEPPQQPAQPTAVTPPRKSRAKAAAEAPAKSLIDTQPIALGMPADETAVPKKATKAASAKTKVAKPETEEPVAKKASKPRKSKTAEQTTENA